MVNKILAIRTDRLGDVMLTLPCATVLKRNFPNAELTFMAREYALPLVRMHGDIDATFQYDPEGVHANFAGVLRLAQELRRAKFDLAVLFYPRLKLALALLLAGIPLRVGTGRRWYSFLLNRRVNLSRLGSGFHELELNLMLLRGISPALGVLPKPEEILYNFSPSKEQVAKANGEIGALGIDRPYAIIHPGSGGSAPNLPSSMFARLARELALVYGFGVIVAGLDAEKPLVEEVCGGADSPRVVGKTGWNLEQYTAVIAGAHFFASNSTGPLHIARALGINLLGFYCNATPCAPDRWGPYNRPESVMIPDPASESKCGESQCGDNCLASVRWETIESRLSCLLV